jgi:hypothetical protein
VLFAAAIVLGLYWLWTSATPLMYRLFPELGATKTGPAAFPVSVHLGEDNIAFTNGATASWTCQVALGARTAYLSTFTLEPKQTRWLSYRGFRGTDAVVDVAVVRAAARRRIAVACREPSGITHFWQF